MAKITIDGTEYDTEQLSDSAKAHLVSIQFVDRKIETLKNEIAVLGMARRGYADALGSLLKEGRHA
jgi:hypothetical protein